MAVSPADPVESGAPAPSAAAPALPSGGAEPLAETPRESLPEVGKVWQGVYDVREALGEIVGARSWRAVHTGTGDAVVLRAVAQLLVDPRRQAWDLLQTIEQPNLQRALASHVVGSMRIEVQAAPAGEPLTTWRAKVAPEPAVIEQLLRDMTAALGALHGKGLAHFGVRATQIYVTGSNGARRFVLGGLERVQLFQQEELVPVAVDALYAPPEAAGLFQHSPGPGLCAWDWWSLGRVVQTFVLGQHVLGQVLQRDVSRSTPELQAHAETLLLERDSGETRAGAVEAMPALEPRLELLLRGLLTSARDARWDGETIGGWLRREPVKEYYRLPRNERMFRWHGRAYTVTEVVELLRSAEHWAEAGPQLWDTETPGTLAHFLGDSPTHRPLCERQAEVRKLATAFALRTVPPEVAREALTAVALLELSGGRLMWRGYIFDAEGLQAIFGAASEGVDRLALLQAFAARPVAILIERCDLAAARALGELAEVANTAESLLRQRRWLGDQDVGGRPRLLRHALRSLNDLRAHAKTLHEQYACSTEPAMEKLFTRPHPVRAELVVLAWASDDIAAHGFLTHREWAEVEYARLRGIATGQAAAFSWWWLARALGAGPWIFARWRWLVPSWLMLAATIAVLWPGPRWVLAAAAPLVFGTGLRVLIARLLRIRLKRYVPGAAPWQLTDGVARCRNEVVRGGCGLNRAELQKALQATNADILKLTALPAPPVPVSPGPRFAIVWGVSLASWLLVFAALGVGGWRMKTRPPSWKAIVQAWHPAKAGVAGQLPGAAGAEKAEAKKDEAAGPVKVSWPFRAGDEAQVLTVHESFDARSEHTRAVLARGAKLVEPYKPETISTLIILPAPVKDKIAVMIYDGQRRELANARVYILDYRPMPRTWVEVGGKKGIFIGD